MNLVADPLSTKMLHLELEVLVCWCIHHVADLGEIETMMIDVCLQISKSMINYVKLW